MGFFYFWNSYSRTAWLSLRVEFLWSLIQFWITDPVFDHSTVRKNKIYTFGLSFLCSSFHLLSSHPSNVHLWECGWLHLLDNPHYVLLSSCRQQEGFLLILFSRLNSSSFSLNVVFQSLDHLSIPLLNSHPEMFFLLLVSKLHAGSSCSSQMEGAVPPFLSLLAVLSETVQPRMLLAFTAARAHCS